MEADQRVVKLFNGDKRRRNNIQTNKYCWYDFIPKNLMEQFSQLGNLYFLIVAMGQLFPSISNTKGRPATLMPLSVVVIMQAVKDLFEDYQRIASDKTENSRQTTVVDERLEESSIMWGNIQPGMVLKIKEGELFPADCLLLMSSHQDGHCSVETANLDGETNLKKKSAALSTKEFEEAAENCRHIGMGCAPSLICEAPNGDLYSFKSSLCLQEEESRGLGVGSLLMRGTSLQQTAWVLCMAVYVGSETRSFKNLRAARFKSSALDEKLNQVVAMIFVTQIAICVLISILSLMWQGLWGHELWYLEGLPRYGNPLVKVGIWFLMLNSMVPLSLMITTTVVKFAQGAMLVEDTGTFSKGRKAEVHTSQVIDSLGQVTHVFSDKTGTLTQNVMEYRCCSVGRQIYGMEDLHEVLLQEDHVCLDATELSKALEALGKGKAQLTSFFLCHALCHTVEASGLSESPYNASSPDELALVCAAKALGLGFVRLEQKHMVLMVGKAFERLLEAYGWQGGAFKAELLEVCEFDNVRKRMSVLLRMPDNELVLYVKGADSSVLPHLAEQDAKEICEEQLLTFARRGLRTLCLAERVVSEQEYRSWSRRYEEAKAMITEERAEKIHELCAEIETVRPVKLLGSTAIDDKLQDEVPETIEQLRLAGVRVWVLTGDKVDTAISIAMSCKLLTSEMNNFVIDQDTDRPIQEILEDVLEADQPALTIAGSKLHEAMEDETRELLFRAGQRCRSVVCCRVSPKQKADVVDLVKSMDKSAVTLSIGDGANDVSMIVAAHVGVGLCGKEGAQAARSADFALAEFRLLRRVVFGHGREAYRRNAMVCIYSFYKNQVNVLVTILASVWNAFSGPNVVNPWLMQCYNIVHCHMPIFVFAMHDREAELDVLEMDFKGHKPYLFGMDVQFLWMATALVQSSIILMAWSSVTEGLSGVDGPDLAQTTLLGNLCFISVVLCVNVALMFRQHLWPRSIVGFYVSNLVGLVATVLICVRGLSQLLGRNLLRVSLTFLVVLVVTTAVGELMISLMELFNDEGEAAVRPPAPGAEPLVAPSRPVRLTRPSLGFAFSEECSMEREKDKRCSVSFQRPEAVQRATVAGATGDIELSFMAQRRGSL